MNIHSENTEAIATLVTQRIIGEYGKFTIYAGECDDAKYDCEDFNCPSGKFDCGPGSSFGCKNKFTEKKNS